MSTIQTPQSQLNEQPKTEPSKRAAWQRPVLLLSAATDTDVTSNDTNADSVFS